MEDCVNEDGQLKLKQNDQLYDWSSGSVVIPRREAIAVYLNEDGWLVVVQEGHYLQGRDHFVFIAPEDVPERAAAMAEAHRLGAVGPGRAFAQGFNER